MITPSIDTRTNGVVSNAITDFTPRGNEGSICLSAAFTRSAVASALAPEVSETAIPVADLPLYLLAEP